jgi:DNA-binding GntR family transcriptional regulator
MGEMMTFDRWWRENGSTFRTERDAAKAAWLAGRTHLQLESKVALSPAQQRLREAIASHWAREGRSPTIRGLARELGASGAATHELLRRLVERGVVVKGETGRGIRLVNGA